MATTISRTWYNGLIDDDGTLTTGTVWDKAAVDSLLDAIDAIFAAAVSFDASVYINDTANANMTLGLTINQGAANNDILAFKSSGVAHGMTDVVETDTYGQFRKPTSAGGLVVRGFGGVASVASLYLAGANATAADTTHTAAGVGVVQVDAYLKSAATIGAVATNGNLFVVTNNASTRFIVDADGDTFQDGTAGTAYSDYDDPMLALAVEHHFNPKRQVAKVFKDYCRYNKDTLIKAGILAPDGPNGERGFVNMSALTRLAIGGLWQLGAEQRRIKRALVAAKLLEA